MAEIFHAIVYEHTPALGGSPAITQLDRVIHKALQKNYSERYQTAEKMAEELRVALLCERGEVEVQARPITRLMVLPFRILRPDADTDFLSFSLPDAIASSLSGLDSLVVRSSLVASRFSSDPIDLRAIAREAEVDAVLTGTCCASAIRFALTLNCSTLVPVLCCDLTYHRRDCEICFTCRTTLCARLLSH